jgi:hypothetical protein
MIYYFRFDTELQAKEVLSEFVQNGEWVIASHTHSLDPIGSLVTEPAQFDEHGNVVVSAVVDFRFHVNFQGHLPFDVSAFQIVPTNPRRVWA